MQRAAPGYTCRTNARLGVNDRAAAVRRVVSGTALPTSIGRARQSVTAISFMARNLCRCRCPVTTLPTSATPGLAAGVAASAFVLARRVDMETIPALISVVAAAIALGQVNLHADHPHSSLARSSQRGAVPALDGSAD